MKYKYCIIRKIKKNWREFHERFKKQTEAVVSMWAGRVHFGEAAVPMQPKVSFV